MLFGLGGIGKTQLAVDFCRRHHAMFSSVLWLDGRNESSLKQSIASYAHRIPEGQISDRSRNYILTGEGSLDGVIGEVLDWLERPGNTEWLLVFDNVDLNYQQHQGQQNQQSQQSQRGQQGQQGLNSGAYDINKYLPGDHGSVLVTTRLSQLAQLGNSRRVSKVGESQARAIFEAWYENPIGRPSATSYFPKHRTRAR